MLCALVSRPLRREATLVLVARANHGRHGCALRPALSPTARSEFARGGHFQRTSAELSVLSVEVRPRLNKDPKAHSQTLTLTLALSTQRALWPSARGARMAMRQSAAIATVGRRCASVLYVGHGVVEVFGEALGRHDPRA